MDWEEKIDAARPEGQPDAETRFENGGGLGTPTDTPDADLLAERNAFYATHPYASFKARIDEKLNLKEKEPWWRRAFATSAQRGWSATAIAGVAAAMLVFVVIPDEKPTPEQPASVVETPEQPSINNGTRSKGTQPRNPTVEAPARQSVVQIGLRTNQANKEVLPNGIQLHPEQRIWFSYATTELDHLFLVGINDKQEPVALYPDSWNTKSAEIAPGRISLQETFVLDEYLGYERFIAVFSRTPISGEKVQKAAAQAIAEARINGDGVLSIETLPLGSDCAQTSVLIEKVAN